MLLDPCSCSALVPECEAEEDQASHPAPLPSQENAQEGEGQFPVEHFLCSASGKHPQQRGKFPWAEPEEKENISRLPLKQQSVKPTIP